MVGLRRLRTFPLLLIVTMLGCGWLSGCAGGRAVRPSLPAGYPIGYTERGTASWYGPGFHGNKTASGESYDMHQFTAAHRTLPLGSVVQVRSATSGRSTTVRINDRGPFAKGRIIDLSLAAAQALGMVGPGTDQVELRVTQYVGRPGAMGYLQVQVASFVEENNARALAAKLRGHYPDVRIVTVELTIGRRYRVLVGRYTSEQQAQAVAEWLSDQFSVDPLVLRDDT
jgi:rare lipoprotein A